MTRLDTQYRLKRLIVFDYPQIHQVHFMIDYGKLMELIPVERRKILLVEV
jgi:hypothetical protein